MSVLGCLFPLLLKQIINLSVIVFLACLCLGKDFAFNLGLFIQLIHFAAHLFLVGILLALSQWFSIFGLLFLLPQNGESLICNFSFEHHSLILVAEHQASLFLAESAWDLDWLDSKARSDLVI